jgi:peroxiredoxin Q/BCP
VRGKAAHAPARAPKQAAPPAKKATKKAPAKPAVARKSKSGSATPMRSPAPAQATLAEGDRAPSFELPDQAGGTVSSESLSGHPYVLYFYPKDDTPGCTTQACGFRDSFADFDGAGVRVLGVSPDSVASHQKFIGKYGLPFTLLSDSSRSLASAYGVWALKKLYGRESMGIVRSTFLVDAEGVIRKVWRGVRVNGHIAEVQAAAAQLA